MPSIPTEALLDVNVIIASVFADHVMHRSARRFVESLDRFYTTPTVQGGFLRFATRPLKNERGEQQPPRLAMDEALNKLREITEVAGHTFLKDDAPFTDLGCVRCKDIASGQTHTFFISHVNTVSRSPHSRVA